MTHARPLPDAATPPYPAQPEAHEAASDAAAATPAATGAEPGREGKLSTGAKVGIGAAAVGIGSAAIAAALLYANRDRKGTQKR